MHPPPPHRAVLCLTSNVEDRPESLQGAFDALLEAPGVDPVALSPIYETAPPAGAAEHPAVLTAVLVLDSTLTPAALLERAQGVEDALQRTRPVETPPPVTLDLITVGDETREDPGLTLPHPRAHERASLLLPWYDIDPHAALPRRGPIADLLPPAHAHNIHRRDDLQLRPPA